MAQAVHVATDILGASGGIASNGFFGMPPLPTALPVVADIQISDDERPMARHSMSVCRERYCCRRYLIALRFPKRKSHRPQQQRECRCRHISQAVTVFAPMLVKAEMKQEEVQKIFTDNAQRVLAFTSV